MNNFRPSLGRAGDRDRPIIIICEAREEEEGVTPVTERLVERGNEAMQRAV